MKILLDMRPALDGFSGIPQETRLLFRGLAGLPGIEVCGLLQSSNLLLDPGLPTSGKPPSPEAAIDALSRVVVSLQQGPSSHRLEHLRKRLMLSLGSAAVGAGGQLGLKTSLTRFEARHFKDYVWRALFAKTLPPEDIDVVTAQDFRVLRWPWSFAHAVAVATAGLGRACYPRLDTRGFDVLLAETPFPGRLTPGTRMVVRYHDAVPMLMPHTIKDRGYHRAMHFHALRRNAADGAWFSCVSEATRQDLLSILPELEQRAVTIPNMVSHSYFAESASAARVPEIIWSRKNRQVPQAGHDNAPAPGAPAPRYLLMVSTIEPRKNHLALIDAWELLRAECDPDLQLVCVGNLGWEHQSIMKRMAPWLLRGGLHLLENVPAADLRLLYRHAQATVCPSFGEGFDFSGVEALASGGVVAASDIRVHKDVYGEAARYFSAYDVRGMADVIARLIDPAAGAEREARVAVGQRTALQYRPEEVMPQWQRFLQQLAAAAPGR
jgi:glycosyltransferase involved in cell wall biosynthesis